MRGGQTNSVVVLSLSSACNQFLCRVSESVGKECTFMLIAERMANSRTRLGCGTVFFWLLQLYTRSLYTVTSFYYSFALLSQPPDSKEFP